MQGFKSFPDRTELKFNKGITAVVGPNGSGKSNIADAMRWVMGEQSSKALRGEKMAGVIFHGCETRKESPFAQVTLTIDNSDRALSVENDIVAVSRKLYKNGDSEYLINGSAVRLKEVNELLMDTGLGKDGYSIIGQGRIADIVNGKSADRREIFEEAAGIAKFRYKKHEAEGKLAAAEENIARLSDIITELEDRLGPLEKQCEKAKKFRVLDSEKRKLEVSVWVQRLEDLRKRQAEQEERLKLLKEQHTALSEQLAGVENEINEDLRLSAERSAQVDEIKEKIHSTELECRSGEADIAVCENDITHMEENIARLNDQIEQSRSNRFFLEAELKKQEELISELGEKQEAAGGKVSDKEKEFDSLISEAEESDKAIGEVNSRISAAYLKKSRLSFTCENLKNTICETEEQINLCGETKEELEGQIRFAESELKKLRKSRQDAEEKQSENRNRLAGMTKLLDKRKEKLEAAQRELGSTELSLNETAGRLQILKDLENSMEGFARSVKSVMTAKKQGRIKGVLGTVAQLISVKQEYSVAIETAVGGALQNIVVENEDCAKRGIRLLKESNAGRATFLPLTSVRGSDYEVKGLSGENGYVAMASELVSCEDRLSGIVKNLLGRICVCEDIDTAAAAARKYGYKFKIVTLDGQVINAGGSFTGGSVSKSTGILTRKNEIDELEKKRESLEKNKNTIAAEKEKLYNEVNKLAADTEGVKEQLAELDTRCLRLDMEIKRAGELGEELKKKLDGEDSRSEELIKKLKEVNDELDEACAEMERVDKEILDNEADLSTSVTRQEELKERRQRISEELQALRITAVEISKDIQSARESAAQLRSSIEQSSGESGKTELGITEIEENINKKRGEIERIRERIENADREIKELERKADTAQREHLFYDGEAAKLRSSQKNKFTEKEELASQMTRAEERITSVENEFDKLAARLWDEYELTRSDAAKEAVKIEDQTEAEKELTSLRNRIRALGSVNLGAIEEYAEVSERYGFLMGQLEDVNVSKEELCRLIDSLTENMKTVFIQSFEVINRNFKSIFSELFGGGRGELILTDPDNVLECGIEINVQPPGKVITSLMSLSGGEQALAAIAIYFAILKNSPSPFCLLDEIEAALDEVNVTRYAQYLHRLTDKTQFITITHRRGTMEEADILYGVTMQEKGISKLLKMSAAETGSMSIDS